MAASIFPREIICPPKEWAEALWPNLFYWNELDKGGHFVAFEQPKLFAEEMRKAFQVTERMIVHVVSSFGCFLYRARSWRIVQARRYDSGARWSHLADADVPR
jgi:hypothetical protein